MTLSIVPDDFNLEPVQTLWVDGRLSRLERLCLSSFVGAGHRVHLYTYAPAVADLPDGVVVFNAREILAEKDVFTYGQVAGTGEGSLAGFSDLFRYKLLLDRGGWWVDADVVCLKPFLDCQPYLASQRDRDTGRSGVASCVLRFPPGSDAPLYLYEQSKKLDCAQLKWGRIGPDLLWRAVSKFDLQSYIGHPDVYCPVDWFNIGSLTSCGSRLPRRSRAVHFWNEMWRRSSADKDAGGCPGSIYERLLLKHGM